METSGGRRRRSNQLSQVDVENGCYNAGVMTTVASLVITVPLSVLTLWFGRQISFQRYSSGGSGPTWNISVKKTRQTNPIQDILRQIPLHK